MKKGNNAFTSFKMPQSKKAAEEEAAKNQAWWDRWAVGNWQSPTYLYIPHDLRGLTEEGVDLEQYRVELRPAPLAQAGEGTTA